MTEIRMEPIADASVWRGEDLAADRSWAYELDERDVEELGTALAGIKARGDALAEITPDGFPLPTLSAKLARVAADLRGGRGFAFLRGFPVDDYSFEDLEKMYWGLCRHIGTGITQNGDAGLIHYVTEGPLRPNQGNRGVGFPKESPLHVDLTDIVTLLCVRQAPDDPPSRIASSTHIYNEVLRRRPDALARLYEGFEWDRMEEHSDGETPTSGYRVPFFSQAGGELSCRYNRNWITSAARRLNRPLTDEENEIFDLIDELAFESRFEFPFHAGDIQFCSNYTVLHGRASHAVEPEMDRRRVLMRIWLDMPEFRDFADEALVRYGMVRHGQLGWTAEEILAGANETARPRRADGAVALG